MTFSLRSLFCIWDGSRTPCAHFRALSHADSDFKMTCAISAAESESAKSWIGDRELNYLGFAIMYQSEGSVVVNTCVWCVCACVCVYCMYVYTFYYTEKIRSINFPSSFSYHLTFNLFSSLSLWSSVSP